MFKYKIHGIILLLQKESEIKIMGKPKNKKPVATKPDPKQDKKPGKKKR